MKTVIYRLHPVVHLLATAKLEFFEYVVPAHKCIQTLAILLALEIQQTDNLVQNFPVNIKIWANYVHLQSQISQASQTMTRIFKATKLIHFGTSYRNKWDSDHIVTSGFYSLSHPQRWCFNWKIYCHKRKSWKITKHFPQQEKCL